MRMPDGSTHTLSDNDKNNIYKQLIPDAFNLAWRIEAGSEKSMYNGRISNTQDYDGHRFCACVNVKEKEEVLCAFDEECRKIQDITGIVRKRTIARRKRSADPNAEYLDDDYFSDFDDSTWNFDFNPKTYLSEVRPLLEVAPTAPPGTHRSIATFARGSSHMQGGTGTVRFRTRTVNKVLMRENSPWPTPSGWTEQQAIDFCNNFVRNSDAVKVCKDIPDVNYQDDIDMCVSDIALSDTTDFAISAVQSINTKCQEKVVADMRLWTANLDPRTNSSILSRVAPPSVMTMMCPNDCSLNGRCVDGKCECNAGYMGADCSGASNEPPSILILPGAGLCNYKRRPCRATPVLGDNFIDSPTLKCRFETAQLAEGGPVGTGQVVETTPEFESYMEIHCPLPPAHIRERGENTPPRHYLVSITNDGDVMSNTKPLLVFNGQRYDCTSVNTACAAPQA